MSKHSSRQPAADGVRGHLSENEPMSAHTSWAVGGPARRFFAPADMDDLAAFLAMLEPDEPLFWLGLGSNLLVRDGGIDATVIYTAGLLNALEQTGANSIRAEAGVSCARTARFCGRCGLTGGEFLAGIPGTMGGALAMNAGAFGGETWGLVDFVEVIGRNGERRVREQSNFKVGYRSVQGPADEWFVAAHLRLEPGDSEQATRTVRELLARRAATQPTGERSCGSVFRNPDNDFAARLIEASGLKGLQLGGARVSDKHANFIINTGGATAADLEALIRQVQDTVEAHQGVRLQTEVRIVGEPA